MSKRSSSKSDKGCVGFVADGVIRKATIYAFKTNDKDPSEIISELQQYFGSVKGKYICVSDVDDVYDKFMEELKQYRVKETPLFSVSITTGNNALKQVSGTTKSHNIKSSDDSDDADGEDKDKEADKEVEPEVEPEEKQTKKKTPTKTTKTKKVEKEESENEDENNDDNDDGHDSDEDTKKPDKDSDNNSDSDEDEKKTKAKPKLKKKSTKTDDSTPAKLKKKTK